MKNHLKTLSTALALITGVSFAAPAIAQSECNDVALLFNNFLPPNHTFWAGGFKPWADDVARVTDGRVAVTFTTASLAPPPKQWGMVTDGIADVAMQVNPMESKRLHLPNIGGLPFVGNLATARGVALWRTHEKFFAAANEFKGVHLVGHFSNPGAGLIAGDMVDGIDSINGMKFWTIGGPPADIVSAIGAVPVPAPGEEMFNMFSKGVVDGLATNWGAMKIWNAYRYTKSYVDIPGGLYAVDFSVIMNQGKWDSICASDQEAITAVSGETIARNVGLFVDQFDIETQKEVAETDIKIVKPDAAFMSTLEDKLQYARDAWMAKAEARGVDGEAALAYYLEQVAELTAELSK